MLGKTGIRSALLLLMVLFAMPVGAQTESTLKVTRNEAIPDFPETISFYLDAESSLTMTAVEIEYGVERHACGVASSRKPVDLEPGTSISTSWTWPMRVTGPLPPGTRVWWRWRIALEDGTVESTDDQWLTFEDGNHDWQTLAQDAITIAWYDGDQSFAEDLLQAGIEAMDRLGVDLQHVFEAPVQVFVYSTTEDLREAVIFSPSWLGGRAYPSYGIILMAIPPRSVEYGQEVLRHELSHLVVHQMAFNCWGNDIPSWLDEGLAVYAEGEQPYYDELVDEAIENDELLTLQILSGSFSADDQQASLSYAQSYRVLRYLLDTHGRDNVLELLAQIGEGVPIDRALETVYGFDTDSLEVEWRAAVGARARTTSAGTPTATPETTATVEVIGAATPAPTSGLVAMTLSYSPRADLQEAGLVPAPILVGRDAPASAPILPLIAGAVLIAVTAALAILALRRRLPWWPAPLALMLGVLLLAGYGLTRRSARAYAQAAEAFERGQWRQARSGFDEVQGVQPAFLRLTPHLALANRGAAALNLGEAEDARADLESALEAAPDDPAMDLARIYLAQWHLLHGETGDAVPLLDSALEGQPDLAPALSLRAETYWQQGDLEAAAEDAESALAAGRDGGDLAQDWVLGDALAVRGATRLLTGDVEAALADAGQALAHSEAAALAYAVRGGARLNGGHISDAYADAETALALQPGLPLALAVRAGAQLAAGQPAPAALDADAAHQTRPSLAWAHALHAAAAWQLHDVKTAASQAQAALSLDPDATLARAVEAGVALSEGRLNDAWEAANQVLEAEPEQGAALAVRAVVHLLRHRPSEALQDAEAALSAQPYMALAHAARAEAALNLGDVQAALQAADRAVALDGDLALGYAARAGAYIRQSQILAGLEDAEQAMILDPDLALGHLRRGAAYVALHRLALAEADLDRALAQDEALGEALAYQAVLALERQNLEGALALAEAALELEPNLVLAHAWRALALDGMGRFEEAGEAVSEALALDAAFPQAYLARARLSLRQGNVEEALADLDTAVSLAPGYASAYQTRAAVRLAQADYEGGQADADQAVRVLPSVETHSARADLHHFLGNNEAALEDLDRAEQLAPESALPCVSRVHVYEARHDPQAAEGQAEEAIVREPGYPDAYLARAWMHQQRHQYEAAQQDADEALALNPWSEAALLMQAWVEMDLGSPDVALTYAERAVELSPGSPRSLNTRGLLRLQTGEPEEGLADLQQAVELSPGDPFLYLRRAFAVWAAESPSLAKDDVDQAIALMPDHPQVHARAASVWLALGEPESAIEACGKALALDPQLADAYLARGEAYLNLNDASRAVQDLTRALQIDRSDPRGHALRATAYLMQGKLEKARDEAETALSLDSRAARAHLVLCEVLLWEEEFSAALEWCDQALALAPNDAQAYSVRGSVHNRLGQLDEALADLDEAVRLAPESVETYMRRAEAYELQGKLEESIADLEEAQRLTEDLELRADFNEAIEILQSTHVAVDGPADYLDARSGFSIRYPEGWQQRPSPQGYGAVYFAGPMQEGYRSAVLVSVDLTSPYASLSELADDINRQLQWTIAGYEVLERQETRLGGEPAVLQVCRADREPRGQIRLWLVLAIHGRKAVYVMLAAHSDHFAVTNSQFQEILDSFTFTD